MIILGINAYHANASAAIVVDGQLLAAAEEERFNRVKYAAGLPVQAIRYCMAEAGATLAQVDHIAIPRNPRARLAGIVEVKHGRHCVHAEAVDVILVEPEQSVSDQKITDFVPAVIKNQRPPVLMLSLAWAAGMG